MAHARSLPEATPICAGALLHLGNRTAVDQALSRLARSGRLMRVCQGIYMRHVETRFGPCAPNLDKALDALANLWNVTIVPCGGAAAHVLGFTTQILVGCIVAGALLGAPPPVVAQERSVGITYAPRLSLHDESTCCMAIGPWVSIDRLHVEYVIAWDHYWQERRAKYAGRLSPFTAPDAKVDGHLLTILGTLRTWRPTEQLRTRFQAGVRYGTATEPTPRAWGAGAGLTVDYLAGRTVLHGTFRLLWPKPPEFRIGLGFQF